MNNEKNNIKPRKIKSLKKSGYLDKISPSIPKNEEILNIELDVDAFNRVMGYSIILIIFLFAIIFQILLFNFSIWSIIILLVGFVSIIYYHIGFKKGYSIKILVFTNKALYLYDSNNKRVVAEPMEYSDKKYMCFNGSPIHAKNKKFTVNIGVYIKLKSNLELLKLMYFLLFHYCNPKIQIKNRLKDQDVHDVEEEYQKILNKSIFKISNERYMDIHRKNERLLVKYVSYEIITFVIMTILLIFVFQFVFTEEWYLILICYPFILILGMMMLILFPITYKDFKNSFKKINFLPDSNFEICSDGVKAPSNSGDVWFPFEENLIIGTYDSIEKIIPLSHNTNDGIEFKRFNEKRRLYQLGPIEDYEYFYDVLMHHYLNWLNHNDLIPKKEQIKELFNLSDSYKSIIAEKVMLKEDPPIPNISDMPSFYIDSEEAIFKYPKDLYNRFIPQNEKIYYIHQQKHIPNFITSRLFLLIFFIVILSLLILMTIVYIQNEVPDEPSVYLILVYPSIPLLCFGSSAVSKFSIINEIKKREIIFTETKVIFKREILLYPLLYADIKSVYLTSEKKKKRYYKYIKFHSKNRENVETIYGISIDSPILTILNLKCKVKYSEF